MSNRNSKMQLDMLSCYAWSNEAGQLFLSVTHIDSESSMLSMVKRLQALGTKLECSLLVKQSNCTLEMFWQATLMLHRPTLKFPPSSILISGKASSLLSVDMLIQNILETVLPHGLRVSTL